VLYPFFQVILITISIKRNQNTFTSPTLKYWQIWVEVYYHLDICRVTMSAYVESPCMNLKNSLDLCKGFRVEVSVIVDYVADLLGCWSPKFRERVVVSSTMVQRPLPSSDMVLCLKRRSLQLQGSGSLKSCKILCHCNFLTYTIFH